MKTRSIFSALLFLISLINADTLNSTSKNPSMAVTGTQRVSTAITDYVIPVATAGAACNSTTDTIAVTSGHSSQLICQSGVWQKSTKFSTYQSFDFPAGANGDFAIADICYLRFIGDAQGVAYAVNLYPSAAYDSQGKYIWHISVNASAGSGVGVVCRSF